MNQAEYIGQQRRNIEKGMAAKKRWMRCRNSGGSTRRQHHHVLAVLRWRTRMAVLTAGGRSIVSVINGCKPYRA